MQASEERYNNKGAYIVLAPPDFDDPVFHSFEAVTPRPKVYPHSLNAENWIRVGNILEVGYVINS